MKNVFQEFRKKSLLQKGRKAKGQSSSPSHSLFPFQRRKRKKKNMEENRNQKKSTEENRNQKEEKGKGPRINPRLLVSLAIKLVPTDKRKNVL